MSDHEFIMKLLESIQQFRPSRDYIDEGFTYLIGGEFAEFVRQRAYAEDKEQVKSAMNLLEKLAESKEIERQRLLRDILGAISESPRVDEISLFFGPNLRRIRKAIKKSGV